MGRTYNPKIVRQKTVKDRTYNNPSKVEKREEIKAYKGKVEKPKKENKSKKDK